MKISNLLKLRDINFKTCFEIKRFMTLSSLKCTTSTHKFYISCWWFIKLILKKWEVIKVHQIWTNWTFDSRIVANISAYRTAKFMTVHDASAILQVLRYYLVGDVNTCIWNNKKQEASCIFHVYWALSSLNRVSLLAHNTGLWKQ